MNHTRWFLPGILCLLIPLSAGAARLSPCQGQFGEKRRPVYEFSLETDGVQLSAQARSDIAIASRALYDSWADLLSATPPFAVEVNLLLVGKQRDFLSLQRRLAPELDRVSGFYSVKENKAVAFYPEADRDQARRSVIHELSHQLTTTQVGAAPQWLAEGLAEYYEMMVTGSDGHVRVLPNDRHLTYLGSVEPPVLADFFSAPVDSWHREGGKAHYSIAWSLVFFMMETAGGRGALGLVLQQGSTHSCLPWSASAFLHQAWPGGLVDFEHQWREWLAGGDFSEQRL